MANTRIKLDGIQVSEQLLRSPAILAECEEIAGRMAEAAGDGYQTDTYTGAKRVNVSVYPATPQAMQDNYDNNTLEKVARIKL